MTQIVWVNTTAHIYMDPPKRGPRQRATFGNVLSFNIEFKVGTFLLANMNLQTTTSTSFKHLLFGGPSSWVPFRFRKYGHAIASMPLEDIVEAVGC